MACDLLMVLGSGGAMIRWHHRSTHAARVAKAARSRVVAAHDDYCVCVELVLYFYIHCG